MIAYVSGRLTEKYPTHVVVECNGIGYHLNISLHTYSNLPESEAVKLYTHLAIREDAHVLYGFSSDEERVMFRHLISVSGVGASTARAILSGMSPTEVQQAIAGGDVETFKRVKGIGAKSAQRIIVDLKDKLDKEGLILIDNFAGSGNRIRNEALSALSTLGFDRKSAQKVVDELMKKLGENVTVEELVKEALKNF